MRSHSNCRHKLCYSVIGDNKNKLENRKAWRTRLTQASREYMPSAKGLSHGLRPSPFICYSCYIILSALIIEFIFFPRSTLTQLGAFIVIFGALISLLRLAAIVTPLKPEHRADMCFDGLKPLTIWPHYSVLVPLYKEATIVSSLMENLSALNYPQDRLEIIMICEADDEETISAVRANLRPPFKLISVPDSKPKTKPKALNYALQKAKGELVTIYDAEDIPHPQQLKLAAQRFAADETLRALQAPLDYFNVSTNCLSRQFTLE